MGLIILQQLNHIPFRDYVRLPVLGKERVITENDVRNQLAMMA